MDFVQCSKQAGFMGRYNVDASPAETRGHRLGICSSV